jgi:sarcosine oxidase
MRDDYEVIVVGLGAMGSAAVHHLARRGARVLGIDAHPLGHDLGSSHGHHRLIRRSAWDAETDAMAARAMDLWRRLEDESGTDVMRLIGEITLLDRSWHERIERWGIDLTQGGRKETLDGAALQERFPGYRPSEGMVATYEAEAGFLRPEVGIAAHLDGAVRDGAVIRRPEEVSGWRPDGAGVAVTTSETTYRAARLVLTTGPWAAELLADLGLPLQVLRVVNTYFTPDRPDLWTVEHGAPNFLISLSESSYYGLPSIEGVGLKIGRHDGGESTTARTIRRTVDDAEVEAHRDVLNRFMPGAAGTVERSITCMYTMTPDEKYVIDRHPSHPQVAYGCGCSGTSYKFSGVIGEMLTELTLDGATTLDSTPFAADRFAR